MARWRWFPRKLSVKDQEEFQAVFFREQWFVFAIYLVGMAILGCLSSVLGVDDTWLRLVVLTAWLYVALEYIDRPFKRKGILRVRRQARSRRRIES
ncbi:MAG TPA: hypothetical protein VFJ01_06305 [Oleiagrimonas sp.]|nr:hypothetical protein [Oleiagrimonas sp.]